jgi:hypothetical protein
MTQSFCLEHEHVQRQAAGNVPGTTGWSYRQIAAEVGLHWTRVGQIVRLADKN